MGADFLKVDGAKGKARELLAMGLGSQHIPGGAEASAANASADSADAEVADDMDLDGGGQGKWEAVESLRTEEYESSTRKYKAQMTALLTLARDASSTLASLDAEATPTPKDQIEATVREQYREAVVSRLAIMRKLSPDVAAAHPFSSGSGSSTTGAAAAEDGAARKEATPTPPDPKDVKDAAEAKDEAEAKDAAEAVAEAKDVAEAGAKDAAEAGTEEASLQMLLEAMVSRRSPPVQQPNDLIPGSKMK